MVVVSFSFCLLVEIFFSDSSLEMYPPKPLSHDQIKFDRLVYHEEADKKKKKSLKKLFPNKRHRKSAVFCSADFGLIFCRHGHTL